MLRFGFRIFASSATCCSADTGSLLCSFRRAYVAWLGLPEPGQAVRCLPLDESEVEPRRYVPSSFAEDDPARLQRFVEQNSFGIFVSQEKAVPAASHLLFLFGVRKKGSGKSGRNR